MKTQFNCFLAQIYKIGNRCIAGVISLSLVLSPCHANTLSGLAGDLSSITNSAADTDVGKISSGNIALGQITFPDSSVTLHFETTDIRDILKVLAIKSGMNIIYGDDVSGNVTIHLDSVPFKQAFQTVLSLKGLTAVKIGKNIVRVISYTSLTAEQSQATTFTRVYRLKYAKAEDLKGSIDSIRAAASRKGISTVDTKTNTLIISDTQEGLEEAVDLISALDRKPKQVQIEAKIVEASLDDTFAAGVSWSFARTDGANNSFGATKGETITTGPGTSAGSTVQVQGPDNGGAGVDFLNGLGILSNGGLSYFRNEAAFLLAAKLSALASKGKVKVLSTPHITTLNSEEATISVTDEIPYKTETVSNGAVTTAFATKEAGIKLKVKPIINADGRINMEVEPEVSNAKDSPFTGAPPVINKRTAKTKILIKDGETIAIGGLIREETQKVTQGIPILMSIPLLGWLFKNTRDVKRRTELIVFLTPKINAE